MSGNRVLPAALLLSCFAGAAAGDVIYDFNIDTSAIDGTAGALDFKFNPGLLVTEGATLEIFNFSGGTLDGSPVTTGDVTGLLPPTVTFDNGMATNDYFQGFTFGPTFTFAIRLSGPALTSPNGTSTSGSAFDFSMFSDAAGTMPVLTSDATNGFAATVDVNLDGTTTLTNFSAETIVAEHNEAPEPNSFVLAGFMMALSMVLRKFRRA